MTPAALKHLGQHFLHDPFVIERLIQEIGPRPDDAMAEIGSGQGALTFPLLAKLKHLDVIEVDRRLAGALESSIESAGKLTVHQADALKFDFGQLCDRANALRIVGNLPYNISTPLLFHLLEFKHIIDDMHLMLQKEVVDRMSAVPGTKAYGRLTVMLSAWTDIEACFDIGPGAFKPPPRVWSTLVRVGVRRKPRFAIADQSRFAKLVAHLFSMRRKTLGRSLRGQLTSEQIADLSIDPIARAETLEPEAFARLAAAIQSHGDRRKEKAQ